MSFAVALLQCFFLIIGIFVVCYFIWELYNQAFDVFFIFKQ